MKKIIIIMALYLFGMNAFCVDFNNEVEVETLVDMFEDILTEEYFDVLIETDEYGKFIDNPSEESYNSLMDYIKYEAYIHALNGEDIINPSSKGVFEGIMLNY